VIEGGDVFQGKPLSQRAEVPNVTSTYRPFTRKFDRIAKAADIITGVSDAERYTDALPDHPAITATRFCDPAIAEAIAADLAATLPGGTLPDTAVTILIDSSGSQRQFGYPLLMTACDLTVRVLETLDVPVEVIGYTTRAWKGGASRELWRNLPDRRSLPSPGRLNDLLHIVYKDFDECWDDGQPNAPRVCFDLLMRPPYMRENIDGEAIECAAERLRARTETHRIIEVFSDCAPVDESTLSLNADLLLKNHLKAAIRAASAAGLHVLSVSNGASKDPSKDLGTEVYGEGAIYSSKGRDFDPEAAAKVGAASIISIAAPVPSLTP